MTDEDLRGMNLAEACDRLTMLRSEDYCRERSDNFYYTSGRRRALYAEITKVSKRIKELEDALLPS